MFAGWLLIISSHPGTMFYKLDVHGVAYHCLVPFLSGIDGTKSMLVFLDMCFLKCAGS